MFVLFQLCACTFAVIKSYSALSICTLVEQTSWSVCTGQALCTVLGRLVTSHVPALRGLRLWWAGTVVTRDPQNKLQPGKRSRAVTQRFPRLTLGRERGPGGSKACIEF